MSKSLGRRTGTRRAATLWSGLIAAMLAAALPAPAQTTNPDSGVPQMPLPNTLALPTGKVITPAPQAPGVAAPQPVGSFPANMILTPDGKYALVTDLGFREYLTCLSTATGQIAIPATVPALPTDGSTPAPPTSKSLLAFGVPYDGNYSSYSTPGLYFGLAIAPKANTDGSYTAYAAEGVNSVIAVISVGTDGSLTQTGTITMQNGDNPAGLSLDNDGRLYVANNVNAATTNSAALTPGSLVVYNTAATGVVTAGTAPAAAPAPEVARVTLNTKTFGSYQTPSNDTFRPGPIRPFTPTSFPYAVQALPDGSKVYVSSQRDGLVYSVNTTSGVVSTITTGTADQTGVVNSHPIAFALSAPAATASVAHSVPVGPLLYVANAQNDSVSVINTATDATVATIPLNSLLPANSPPGATPNGLALSPNGNTLYVTLADMNAVAVVSLATNKVTGYVPVGWYPTGIAALTNGNLLVANAKGTSQANPNPGHVVHNPPTVSYNDTFYDENLVEGNVQDIAVPSGMTLTADTQTVVSNNIATGGPTAGDQTLQALGFRNGGPIKHVIYIIKENRTYDQVLGDLTDKNGVPRGNGDSTLTIFGKAVTPNLHALENQFALLDNFYDAAEVSGDGWNWSTQSYANEYVIKNVPNDYSDRRSAYDFEGQVNNYLTGGFPARSPAGALYSKIFPNGAPAVPDVDTGVGGYIWDAAEKNGLSFRNYGLFLNTGVPNLSPDNYPSEPGLQPGGHYAGGSLNPDVSGHTDLDFREFDLNYPDSDAPVNSTNKYPEKAYGKYAAPDRFAEWNREFQAMLTNDPTGGTVPNLETIKFMSDHTNGYKTNQPTPVAHVADNDYAVGELVQAVSHSPIWNSTAIFVIEDDAQDGPDHVDCHRSTAYVISPYVLPAVHDAGFHNTDSVLHSIELLLDLPPLTQYDAYAPSFGADFSNKVVNTPFTLQAYTASDVTNVASVAFLKAHPAYKALVAMSNAMDFRKEDRAPAQRLNEVLWKSVKGMNSAMPAPRHGVIPVTAVKAVKGRAKGAPAPARDGDDD